MIVHLKHFCPIGYITSYTQYVTKKTLGHNKKNSKKKFYTSVLDSCAHAFGKQTVREGLLLSDGASLKAMKRLLILCWSMKYTGERVTSFKPPESNYEFSSRWAAPLLWINWRVRQSTVPWRPIFFANNKGKENVPSHVLSLFFRATGQHEGWGTCALPFSICYQIVAYEW